MPQLSGGWPGDITTQTEQGRQAVPLSSSTLVVYGTAPSKEPKVSRGGDIAYFAAVNDP
jgi:hypothetical protein